VEESILAFAKLSSFHHIGQIPRDSLEGFAAKFGILHFFSQSALLRFEHVAQKLIELYALGEGQSTRHELLDKLVAVGGFLGGPAAGA